jgi:hypothetical protein
VAGVVLLGSVLVTGLPVLEGEVALLRRALSGADAGALSQEYADGPIDRIRIHQAQYPPEGVGMRRAEPACDRVATRS